ncbi:hypothetical protein [Actinoplanes sp. NPDC051494]|uniref:hypothetical protein n=1 Tax=Actinoplanes sp. NPDC051494 TaxID=3363907 RepID=UPI0037A94624
MDEIPDRDLLRDRADRRMRLLGVLFAVLVGAALIGGLTAGLGEFRPILLVLVIVPIGVYALIRRTRLTDPTLLRGADTSTQRAVTRALKAGHSADPRVDALARDTARRTLRRRWTLATLIVAAVVMTGSLVLNLTDGELGTLAVIHAISAAAFVAATVNAALLIRRSRHYLREPGRAEAPETAA